LKFGQESCKQKSKSKSVYVVNYTGVKFSAGGPGNASGLSISVIDTFSPQLTVKYQMFPPSICRTKRLYNRVDISRP